MSLRDAMPQTAAFVDFAREVFGAESVNAAIRKGMGGLPGHFHAVEAGREVGTEFPETVGFSVDQLWLKKKGKTHAD